MSDDPGDANRCMEEIEDIEHAAITLSEALEAVKDAAFGLSQHYLDVANDELRHVGVRLVRL